MPCTTRFSQVDDRANVTVTAYLDTGGKTTQTHLHYDDQRRERLRQTTDDSGALGINVETRYRIDSNSNLRLVSNPYRTYSDATMGWTLTTVDQMGRMVPVDTFASSPPLPWGANTTGLGKTVWSYSGNTAAVTEPDNGSAIQVMRSSTTDGLGRRTSVTDGAGTAIYTYNALDNLKTVMQGTQTRTFTYDSLSRLKTATNPENNTVTYAYDASGNLTTRQDARVTATLGYYGQNRLISTQ
jgi:YD repeat-containing protein